MVTIRRKHLIEVATATVVLFVVANPLGDSTHGLGKHNRFAADLGQTIWVLFIIGFLVLIVLSVVALVQGALRRRAE